MLKKKKSKINYNKKLATTSFFYFEKIKKFKKIKNNKNKPSKEPMFLLKVYFLLLDKICILNRIVFIK
ncbi:hypothetical protein BH725_04050 [Clostridium baratii]|nr:hypothetical protein BH725_04050 [Clostridium baratii]